MKFILVSLLASVLLANAQQQAYQQCGGAGFTGVKSCVAGLTCCKKDQYYSQCYPGNGCPAGWTSEGGNTVVDPKEDNKDNKGDSGNTNVNGPSRFGCQFKFGQAFDGQKDYSAADYISIWIGSPSSTHGTNFNPYWHGEMLKTAAKLNKMPLYYGYIIAFMARDQWNLKDCDVGTPSLCQRGSSFIRAHRAAIVAKYKHYSAETAKIMGKNTEMVWLIEPDFWQYYGDVAHQEGGALSGEYMRALFDDIAVAIKSELPNSKISWDISAWIGEAGMTKWWGFFKSSPHVNFIHTSGGQSKANSIEIKQNELKWKFMNTLTGKKIIADTGYGIAGGSTGHNYEYDNVNNLKARMNDGVIAVTQANPRSDWKNTINSLRKQLPNAC